MDRRELADFLRSRRARIRPEDVGLEAGTRRRTPGLRREEVARLAGMSVDYYIRLEQARGPRPSRQILGSLARALRLTDAERDHLHHLAGEPPQPRPGPPQDVPAGILHLLDRLDDTPAFVMDAKYDVLAWNAMAAALLPGLSRLPPRDRNPLRSFFLSPQSSRLTADGEYGSFARTSVADLRAAAGRYPDDPGVTGLVNELLEGSELFARLWAEREVAVRQSEVKVVRHPVVGPIELHCDVLLVPDRDQRVVLYTAAPGTPAYEALRLLRVVGTQDLTAGAAVGEQGD
ncbi:helix-turn-helix transcriptional regulator [Thermomonospora cellulosilytica]|uniref:Transcriptional regulator with XRE-family HTH domain n=1 Tax=Thermomonospora cellulosilytica TaxID=1411118 RepID=A0A7W3MYS7_9ACTN|nr:helix-turn-helix transcriptional regulator [Thermomonospora cellulosilytica]MBA9004346.1 transcriptional regulator with XRE-family HTH domain [Thermomonospora cellulosilytica]